MATQIANCVFNINSDKHEHFLSYNNSNVLVIDRHYAINTKIATNNAQELPADAMTRIKNAFDMKGATLFLRSPVLTILRLPVPTLLTPGVCYSTLTASGTRYWVYVTREDKASGYLVEFTNAVIAEVFGEELDMAKPTRPAIH